MLVFVLVALVKGEAPTVGGYAKTGFGVDETFPIHHDLTPENEGYERYHEFIEGCKFVHGVACEQTERQRMDMNREQACRQRNYTRLGFGRVPAPEAAYGPAKRFWDTYRSQAIQENWPPGNTYVNNWAAPTKMVSFEDKRFQPLGLRTKQDIWDGIKPVLEAWTGQTLKPTSLYGIRIYGPGAILNPHLDRLPLVTSAIMQIDQDLDDPWPVEVIGHDGEAYNVTLMPGEIALYESHTVIHGRPYPLKGRFFANVFVHFIPVTLDDHNEPGVDFDWQKESRKGDGLGKHFPEPPPTEIAVENARFASLASKEKSSGKRPVPAPASHGDAEKKSKDQTIGAPFNDGPPTHVWNDNNDPPSPTGLHVASARGDLNTVLTELTQDPSQVNTADENLWTPLHETARHGDVKVLETLINFGADLSARTIGGASALYIAKQHQNDAAVTFLESIGAPDIPDEL